MVQFRIPPNRNDHSTYSALDSRQVGPRSLYRSRARVCCESNLSSHKSEAGAIFNIRYDDEVRGPDQADLGKMPVVE